MNIYSEDPEIGSYDASVMTARLPDFLKKRVLRVDGNAYALVKTEDFNETADDPIITARLPSFLVRRILRLPEAEDGVVNEVVPGKLVKELKKYSFLDQKYRRDDSNYDELDQILDRDYRTSKQVLLEKGKRKLGRYLLAPYSGKESLDLINKLSEIRDIYDEDICALQEIVIGEKTIDFLVRGDAFDFAKAYVDELYEQIIGGGTTWPLGDDAIYLEDDGAVERFISSYNENNRAETCEDVLNIFHENANVLRGYRAVVAFNLSGQVVEEDVNGNSSFKPHWKIAWKQLQIILNKKKANLEGRNFSKGELSGWDELYLKFPDPIVGSSGKMATVFRRKEVREALYEGYLASEQLAFMAKDIIVLGTSKISRSIARRFARSFYMPFEDFEAEATIGVMRSTERFDPRRNVLFKTYAEHWGKAMCFNHIKSYHSIKLPTYMFSHLMYLKKMHDHMRSGKSELTVEGLVEDLFERIIGDSKRTAKKISEVEAKVRMLFETEQNIFANSFVETGDDENYQRRGESLFEEADFLHNMRRVEEVLKDLPERERDIISQRYIGSERTITDIGKNLNLSRDTVRKIENNALEKLRKRF